MSDGTKDLGNYLQLTGGGVIRTLITEPVEVIDRDSPSGAYY